jgi:hypothetical protein
MKYVHPSQTHLNAEAERFEREWGKRVQLVAKGERIVWSEIARFVGPCRICQSKIDGTLICVCP